MKKEAPLTSYERFVLELAGAQQLLGLTGWELRVTEKKPGRGDGYYAQVFTNPVQRTAHIAWNPTNDPVKEPASEPVSTARHELLHVLLSKLIRTAATVRSEEHPDLVEEEHAVINRLLPLIWPSSPDFRKTTR